MKFTELPLNGAFLIELEPKHDERGYFARTFCTKEFSQHDLVTHFIQCSTSFNMHKGLIRGMHYQATPHEETKLVRCTKGSIHDVIIDLREHSPTFQQWHGVDLTAENGKMLYIPKGFAHGYQVLEDNSEVYYMMDVGYEPEAAREVSYLSSIHSIKWPIKHIKTE